MRVAIIGGGIGGLTLAVALQRLAPAVKFDVYERDADEGARDQGFAISLRGDMGFQALRELGVPAEQRRALASPTRAFAFVTGGGWCLMDLKGGDAADEEDKYYVGRVDRPKLKQLLLGQIDPARVHWNKHAVSFDDLNSPEASSATVTFADGTKVEADVVVGCDGTRSKLRRLMLGDDTRMHNVTLLNGRVADGAAFATPRLSNDNTLFVIDNGASMFLSFNDTGEVAWSLGIAAKPGDLTGLSSDELHALALKTTQGWTVQPVQALLRATPPAGIKVRELVDRAFPTSGVRGRYALLGDAAHPMTPYRGLGANTAMLDAVQLAKRLGAAGDVDVAEALRQYDVEMLQRSKAAVDQSRSACQSFHAKGVVRVLVRNTLLAAMGWMLWALQALLEMRPKK